MAIRIKWDKYETALLIDAFWRIEESPENKKEIISDLSQKLRERAVNMGLKIDDVFRNINGISMQLVPIAHSFFPERPTLTTSIMFDEMVDLYRTDRLAFEDVLKTANEQVGGSTKMNVDLGNKAAFIFWLSSKCPNGISSNSIIKSLEDASRQCVKSKYTDLSFWEMSNVEEFSKAADQLLTSLKWSRFIKSRKRAYQVFKNSIDIYKCFLKEKKEGTELDVVVSSNLKIGEELDYSTIERTEAIYLIDTYLSSIAKKRDLEIAVKEVSRVFRNRALKFDKIINETYRNVSFVEQCFSDIKKLFQNIDNENCNPLLKELVKLYLSEPSCYAQQSKIVNDELCRLGIVPTKECVTTDEKEDKVRSQTEKGESSPVTEKGTDQFEALSKDSSETEELKNSHKSEKSYIIVDPSVDDKTHLSDLLYTILKKESEQNIYGVELYHIAYLAKASSEKVKAILEHSEWAVCQYGKYRFIQTARDTEIEYDFSNPQSLAYTKPTRLLYFEEVVSEAITWRQLFIDFMKVLYEDYPETIKEIVGNVSSSSEIPLVGDFTNSKQFRTPGEFVTGLFIELNRSASSIVNCIEKLLNFCNVDAENVRIFFEHKKMDKAETVTDDQEKDIREEKRNTFEQPSDNIKRRYFRDDKENFYRWLKENQKLDEEVCVKYVSVIRNAEDYARQYMSSSSKLFCDDLQMIESTARTLFADEFFTMKNDQQHDRLFAALRKYLEYKYAQINKKGKIEASAIESTNVIKTGINESIISTLREHFVYGFNTSSPIELMRFRAQYEADHHEVCDLNDDSLKEVIITCGLSYKGKAYIVSQDVKERIKAIILQRIQSGDIIFYYEEIYALNEDWLYEEHVVDSDMLRVLIEKLFPQYQYKERFFIANTNRITEQSALKEEILHVWGEQVLRNYTELNELLPFIPFEKIKYALSYGKEFTWNSVETYARNDYFVVTKEQIEDIITFASQRCDEAGNVSFEELPLEDVIAENYELSETALYDIVYSYMPDTFSRTGKVISKSNKQQYDTVTAIQLYCRQHETCTMEELLQIMQRLEGAVRYPVIIEAASAVMVRVSREDFVMDGNVQFDATSIDKALDAVVVGNGIGLKEVTAFGAFPFCGYAWNSFVLESYCRRFSIKYKYDCITPNSESAGAIIRKSSNLSYHDIMAEALARSGTKLVEENVFDYLIASGFLVRRRYSGMGDLIRDAMKLRKGGV